jgi:hypothetical protein
LKYSPQSNSALDADMVGKIEESWHIIKAETNIKGDLYLGQKMILLRGGLKLI